MSTRKLDASIPANNWKIIELYNKIKKEELDPSPNFQRKLVWKKQHKFNFIETILQNYPFPEIYIAPGEMDIDKLALVDQIVDGQQRCTTIVNYIEGKDVFSSINSSLLSFANLSKEEKADFLNYEVSIRYLKNATDEQVKSIFQRINSTEYALNSTERTNAQWGDSEFICFAKQVIEKDIDVDTQLINYKLDIKNREVLLDFFHEKYLIFSENDISRMLALQYVLTLIATIVNEEYFKRNDKVQFYIETYFEEFRDAALIESKLVSTVNFIVSLNFDKESYWFNKANVFTLIVELSKFDISAIDLETFKNGLIVFEEDYKKWMFTPTDFDESELDPNLTYEKLAYYSYAREAVNEIYARQKRGAVINEMIIKALSPPKLETI